MAEEVSEPLVPGLYVVSTPIGNREDFSARGERILRACDILACEDSRRSRRLLDPLGIRDKEMIICHEHNEERQAPKIAEIVESGRSVALITNAGTPAISDPGFRVVRECRRRNLSVLTVPGPTAAMAALSVSGLPSDEFHFLGFLPPRRAARTRILEKHRDSSGTLIFYESPYRIEKFLDDAIEVVGTERILAVGRELTKHFESFIVGRAAEVRARVRESPLKGEFVILIAKEGFEL
jgi:16S rRNA (cytidine1402-2'-O)-methyltransferase